jgi:hypothetical protein
MKTGQVLVTLAGLCLGGWLVAQQEDRPRTAKEGLQRLNDYIGRWNGNGTSEGNRLEIWKEQADWSWRFKGEDAWLVLRLEPGRYFQGGELHYLPERDVYQLRLRDRVGKTLLFEGKWQKGRLTLQHQDAESGATQQLQMNLAGGGIRFVYTYSVKPAGRTLFTRHFQVGFTREGESFAAAERKVECIVTGGLGTIPVTYQGVTYYVCCTGCRDAFLENPEKYVRAYQERQKKNPKK